MLAANHWLSYIGSAAKSELGLVVSRWCVRASADVCCGKSELLIAITCDELSNDDVRWAPSVVLSLCRSVAWG